MSSLSVEQALRLVPHLESLLPLRTMLFSASMPDQRAASQPYVALAKRGVELPLLRERLDFLVQAIARHLSEQYGSALSALDRFHKGEAPEAVEALLGAGRREERIGRPAAARAWYGAAIELAEGLPDRRPEISALLALGTIDRQRGAVAESARRYQRALALAEAELHEDNALTACLALGEIALLRRSFAGARAWYTRALRRARSGGHPVMIGRVLAQLADLALQEGDVGGAPDLLRRARACFRADEHITDVARLLRTQGLLHESMGDLSAAADYREALMWALRATSAPELELSIRLHLARFHLQRDRLLEAEEEMRRAEQRTLAEGLCPWLVRVYVLMGHARARARDENGFVFFEQAIDLCRSLEDASLLEAQAYWGYGDFRQALGDTETARAYFERAADVLSALGEEVDPAVLRVRLLL